MFKLIGFLFSGCWHKWKIIRTELVNYNGEFSSGQAYRHTLQCEHCGNIKGKMVK